MRQLPDADQPLPNDLQDLDRLIDELEGARIDPQPDVSDAPKPDLENDIDDMVSETLARIYISQDQYEEAARVYLRLASQEPDRAQEHLEKAAALRDRARDPGT
jgi:thioredoxin-like negative regulator of GroEL